MTINKGRPLAKGAVDIPGAFRHRLARSRLPVTDSELERCQELISYRFQDPSLLSQALLHASAADSRSQSNERMEFLGDAVLGLVICQELYRRAPDLPEGELTKIKSSVVSRQTCAQVSDEHGITGMLRLGKGISASSVLPTSLGAAALEAVIGAIYLDGGLEPAREFILKRMGPAIDAAMASRHQRNYKSLLQQHAQRCWNVTPQYEVLDEKGPEHAKCFEVAVRLNGRRHASAWGGSKKQAEQLAALAALHELGLAPPSEIEVVEQ
jgi:ribonuclease-3